MKNFIGLMCVISILFLTSLAGAEKIPLRVVRLPIIFQARQPDYKTCEILETTIARASSIPLNGTLKLVEYIDSKESTAALNEILRQMQSENKKSKLKDAIKPLAEKINADIIICPVLHRYSEVKFQRGRFFETYLITDISATLIVYDRRNDELIEKKKTRSFHDSYNKFGTASYLAKDCFERLIDATQLRQKFASIK